MAKSKKAIVSSYDSRKEVGKEGKSLGAIFSSLSRRKFGDDVLIIPFGKDESGHGLRWKLNERLIKKERLLTLVKELIET